MDPAKDSDTSDTGHFNPILFMGDIIAAIWTCCVFIAFSMAGKESKLDTDEYGNDTDTSDSDKKVL